MDCKHQPAGTRDLSVFGSSEVPAGPRFCLKAFDTLDMYNAMHVLVGYFLGNSIALDYVI